SLRWARRSRRRCDERLYGVGQFRERLLPALAGLLVSRLFVNPAECIDVDVSHSFDRLDSGDDLAKQSGLAERAFAKSELIENRVAYFQRYRIPEVVGLQADVCTQHQDDQLTCFNRNAHTCISEFA